MAAGYSGTPLVKKLGIKEGWKVKIIHAPEDYFRLLETDITSQFCKKNEVPDLVHLFAKNYKDFEAEMWKIKSHMKPTTIIWVSWCKKSSGIATDLTEDVIRNYALQNGLVDVKVFEVNDIWSGLKLVVPLANR